MKTINPEIQNLNKPNARNMKKTIPTHIIVKLLKTIDKEKFLEAFKTTTTKHIAYKATKIRLTVYSH